MSFFDELKRRNVIRVAVGYVVAAWLVIQVVETIFPAFGFGDEAIRFVVIAFAVGFIPVVVLAWVFEWTPEGIRKDDSVDRQGPAVAAAARRWDRIVTAVLAIAVAYFVVEKILEIEDPEPAIAVLPFENLSPDPEQAYFAGGVADEVRTLLGKIPELLVISRGSSAKVVELGLDVSDIAAKLNVAHILEGSVRRAGDRVRVTAQLIEVSSGASLWSESYDETLDDIFEIQAELAENIVENLHIELVGPIPTPKRTDPRALAMLIQAKQIFYQGTISNLYGDAADRMDVLLDAALELDPKFVDAMFWKGSAHWARVSDGEISYEEWRRRTDQIREAILVLEPEHGGVLWGLAWDEAFRNVDFRAAAPLFERAYRSAPNDPEVLRQVARFASFIGRFDISSPLYERAVALDPFCTMCLYHLSRNYMYAGEWDKAEEARERFLLLGGDGGYYHYGTIKLMQGDAEAALEAYRRHSGNGQELAGIAMALHALGRSEESDAALSRLIDRRSGQDPEYVASVYAYRNEADAAFEWLDKALVADRALPMGRMPIVAQIAEPLLENLHDDPRWEEFRKKVGVPTELAESLEFSVDIPQ